MCVELGQNTKFTAHVVGGFDFAAERRTAKNYFARTELHGVGEIRMAAWVLADDQRSSFSRKMATKERFEFREVELLSRSNRCRLILEASHVCLSRSLLTVGQQRRIIQVLKRVECAQGE